MSDFCQQCGEVTDPDFLNDHAECRACAIHNLADWRRDYPYASREQVAERVRAFGFGHDLVRFVFRLTDAQRRAAA
ncbi:hypothetical protein [Deinococcus sp. S9]|uniref:hypothetical protein n=1 Tax=Deinococcus sp. S9 TaxID=2545754 RepID=UPI0010552EB1|nr:hypothetical protein [Deinococcus sp. S9]TDE87409.1 hypothetical protein E0686_02640 [Deinococcus sp. S9]